MPTIFLVHGTYAQEAPWTRAGSDLRVRLENEFAPEPLAFRTVEWSGNNRHSDRIQAANALVREIESTLDRDSEERIFVIGHSHGGNIISIALKASDRVAQGVDGCVYISTPFVVALRRDYFGTFEPLYRYVVSQAGLYAAAAFLFYGALNLPASMVWAMPAFFYSTFAWLFLAGDDVRNVRLPGVSFWKWAAKLASLFAGLAASFLAAVWAFSAAISLGSWRLLGYCAGLVAFLAVGSVLRYALVHLKLLVEVVGDCDKITHAVEVSLENFTYPNTAPDKALFIRFTSDEAGLALSAAQALSKAFEVVIKLFLYVLSMFTREFWRVGHRGWSKPKRLAWWALLSGTLLLGAFFIGVPILFASFVEAGAKYLLVAATTFSLPSYHALIDASYSVSILRSIEALKFDPGISIDRLTLMYVLVFPLTACIALMALLARTFGSSYFWAAPLINLSVEPTPPGNSHLIHFTPGADFTQSWSVWGDVSLVHSQGYLDCRALDAIAVFVRERCAS